MSGPEPDREIGIETLIAEGLQRLASSGEQGLDQVCAAHPQNAEELRRRIGRLRERGLIERPKVERVGPYRVLRTLGKGGMGEVYLAEQCEPVRRLVALKIVRDDVADPTSLARFDAERQTLASMDHPGIAHVYDAGATEDGRPFLVMEYIDGRPVTVWCDENRLRLEDRLALFAEICDAVHHAHQNGIIHRDIKPSNILVKEFEGRPRPKMIDFGLAKAFGTALTAQSLQTHAGQVLGTPAYMSPEQASGDGRSVDVRTDVYALGALLYELACGTRPFDDRRLQDAGILEMLRILREEEPPSPSRRLGALGEHDIADVAAHRRSTTSAILRGLHGELDWMVQKAIAKIPRDRYASVSELAADVRRHLAGHAVLAGPPTASYRLWKFVRRHRTGVAIASVALVSAIAALMVILRLGFEARENLRHFDRLASRNTVAELLREAEEDLWPIRPSRIPAMRDWLNRAQLVSTTSRVEIDTEIEALGARGTERQPNESVLLEGLIGLNADLVRLAGKTGAVHDVESRINRAGQIQRATVDDHAADWQRTIDGIRAAHDIEFAPITGLIPLGPDPDSHLFEFVVVTEGGRIPQRDDHGHIMLRNAEEDPVLVLLPGGRDLPVGSQSRDPKSPHFDPQRGTDETPLLRCDLDPFLVSKFEITQAQWRRVMGSNPSTFAPDQQAGRAVGVRSELHPVESVSWRECVAFCTRLGLELPSEPQWEYAARGGTDGAWWTGTEPQSVRVGANLSDKARADRYELTSGFEEFNDGHAVHAPVGSFQRNRFGLYDVTGNVWEWARSGDTSWPPARGDAEKVQPYCGGGFTSLAVRARITCVQAESGLNRKHVLGLRPVLVPTR